MLAALVLMFQAGTGQTAFIPYPWLEFCGRTLSEDCRLTRELTVDDVFWIHVTVGYGMKPADEVKEEGTTERWTAFPESRQGDCADYAWSKRQALRAYGMPASAMTIVIGEVDTGRGWERHAVLEVNVAGKTLVLDSLSPDALYTPGGSKRPWRELARQSSERALWTPK